MLYPCMLYNIWLCLHKYTCCSKLFPSTSYSCRRIFLLSSRADKISKIWQLSHFFYNITIFCHYSSTSVLSVKTRMFPAHKIYLLQRIVYAPNFYIWCITWSFFPFLFYILSEKHINVVRIILRKTYWTRKLIWQNNAKVYQRFLCHTRSLPCVLVIYFCFENRCL